MMSKKVGLGVYHYNGHTWTRVSSVLGDGYAVSDHGVWASTGGSVEDYSGHNWAASSLTSLLPAKDKNDELVSGIIALSAKNVYALDVDYASSAPTVSAALYVLHYDSRQWSKDAGNNEVSLQ